MAHENNIKPEENRPPKEGQAADKAAEAAPALLRDEEGRLCLAAGGQTMYGDFSRLLPRTQPNNLNGELVVRACRPKKAPVDGRQLTVLDATAGMGEDSFLLAAAGFEVTLYERDHTIFLLLEDTLKRAAENPETAEIAARMHLIEGDSIEGMRKMAAGKASDAAGSTAIPDSSAGIPGRPDIILLDPMFPERKKSGLVKKKFQLIHYLEMPCTDEDELLGAARAAYPSRIVIKRPAKGPFLAGQKPSFSLKGGSIRYDIIIL